MSEKLDISISGLQDFSVSFKKYCESCDIQSKCEYGKSKSFEIKINCNDLNQAKEKVKYDQLKKLQKEEDVSTSYEELIKKVKINLQEIIAHLWQEKVKKRKEELTCLDSRKIDPILVAQQGQDWWRDFLITLKEINKECEKIT
ncbi:MAG: hypothetical protein P8Y70_09730 [Candidatus Lokiarchaeota archaeon]